MHLRGRCTHGKHAAGRLMHANMKQKRAVIVRQTEHTRLPGNVCVSSVASAHRCYYKFTPTLRASSQSGFSSGIQTDIIIAEESQRVTAWAAADSHRAIIKSLIIEQILVENCWCEVKAGRIVETLAEAISDLHIVPHGMLRIRSTWPWPTHITESIGIMHRPPIC